MSSRVSLFTLVFCGLSSGFDILRTLNLIILKNLGKQYSIESNSYNEIIAALLNNDNSFYFNNLCAKLKFFGALS